MRQEQVLHSQIVELLPRLRRFCWALMRNSDAGDDLCQATIERALARADRFEMGTRLDSWMFRIARNLQIDDFRRRQTRGDEVDIDQAFYLAGEDGRATVEGRSDLARAQAAMAGLSPEQRELIALVVIDGRSYKDAAELLGIPIGTVMSRLARARRAIDIAIKGQADDR